MQPRRYLPVLVLLIVVIVVQQTLAAIAVGYLSALTNAAYSAVAVLALCMLMGYAGQISLGHAGFVAIGAYWSARLTTLNLLAHAEYPLVARLDQWGLLIRGRNLYGQDLLYISPHLAGVTGVLATMVVAWVIGRPLLRLRGHYLAMATLGFGFIVHSLVIGSSFTGGSDGLTNVPPLLIYGDYTVNGLLPRQQQIHNYYIAWGLVMVVMVLLINLVHSRMGRALRAIHGAPDAAEATGIDTTRCKLGIFVLSAGLAALAGVFMVHYRGGVGPGEASIMKSVRYVAIVAVGGMANLWGALSMATLLTFMSLRGWFGEYDDTVFAAILIVIMLLAPQGLLHGGPWVRAWRWLRRRPAAGGEAT